MIIIRITLIGLVIYLLVRSFILHELGKQNNNQGYKNNGMKFDGKRKISKNIGEFVDYEEVDEKANKKN